MPLSLSNYGMSVRVSRIGGGEAQRKRLESLGFTAGSIVTVVSRLAGSLIVKVKDSRIAVDRELAGHIFVSG